MIVIPAIDLMGNKVVRLVQGDKQQKKVYSVQPSQLAAAYGREGAAWIHVVDLDSAFNGRPANRKSIAALVKNTAAAVEIGGGLRTLEDIQAMLDLGIKRVVLGTVAARDPGLVGKAVARWGPECIIGGIDAKNGQIAIRGWVEATNWTPVSLAAELKKQGLLRLIYTDICRDGMLEGPNIAATRQLARQSGMHVIASGGVSRLADLEKIRELEPAGVEAVIVGKALYEHKFTFTQAQEIMKKA